VFSPHVNYMKSVRRSDVERALGEAAQATKGLEHAQRLTRESLERAAKRYSGESCSFLIAILGGVMGAATGLLIKPYVGVLVVLSGPLGAAFGTSLALLAWRGQSYWRLERATERLKLPLETIRREIGQSPRDAPSTVREKLWSRYDSLLDEYMRTINTGVEAVTARSNTETQHPVSAVRSE